VPAVNVNSMAYSPANFKERIAFLIGQGNSLLYKMMVRDIAIAKAKYITCFIKQYYSNGINYTRG
jgi:hypothetical protein